MQLACSEESPAAPAAQGLGVNAECPWGAFVDSHAERIGAPVTVRAMTCTVVGYGSSAPSSRWVGGGSGCFGSCHTAASCGDRRAWRRPARPAAMPFVQRQRHEAVAQGVGVEVGNADLLTHPLDQLAGLLARQ